MAKVEPVSPIETPRAARHSLLLALADAMKAALAAGDVETARIAHDAIGRLLPAPGSDGGSVVDLATERDRRGV